MPSNHFAVDAVPATGATSDLRSGLVARYAYCLTDAEDAADFIAVDPDTGDICPALIQAGAVYGLDNTDTTTAAGPTCLISYEGKRYKLNSLSTPFSVLDKDLTAPPVSPTIGDAYLIYGTPSGAWSGKSGYIAVYTSRGWEFIQPQIGFRILVEDENSFYFRDSSGNWTAGLGSVTVGSKSIALSNLIWAAASPKLRVVNQTSYAPPGARKTGATPAVPLGGTASNINDNNDSTTSVTSALSDLTGASVASRIIAKLTLAATTDLICIEARGVLGSTTSSSNAMGLYYSTDSGSTWTQAGSGFTLSATAQNVQRTGTFAGVTDIALVTEAKNWSTNTNTLAGLNAYDATVTASVGDAYVIASGAFGIWAGDAGKVAICELANSFTIYTPSSGDEVYDIALNATYRWNGSAWISAAGSYVGVGETTLTNSTGLSSTGASFYVYSASTAPTTSSARTIDPVSLSYTASRAGAILEFTWRGDVTRSATLNAATNGSASVGLYRDSESNAVDWCRHNLTVAGSEHAEFSFEVAAADASSHTYTVAFTYLSDGTDSYAVSAMNRHQLRVRERA